jgi:hypothetical protein
MISTLYVVLSCFSVQLVWNVLRAIYCIMFLTDMFACGKFLCETIRVPGVTVSYKFDMTDE